MKISKAVIVLLSFVAEGSAIKCWYTDHISTQSDVGHPRDCPTNDWCVSVYDSKGEYDRRCGAEVDELCRPISNNCQTIVNGAYGLPPGSTGCCCNQDLCNAPSSASSATSSVILLIFSIFAVVFLAFK